MNRMFTLAMALFLFSPLALAHPESECAEKDGKRRPPLEAVEACEGLQLDDVCAFEGREGQELVGTCFLPEDAPAKAPVACRPNDAPPPRRR